MERPGVGLACIVMKLKEKQVLLGERIITLFMRAEYISGEVKVMEPKKCKGWIWNDWYRRFPGKVFVPIINLKKQGYDPFRDLE